MHTRSHMRRRASGPPLIRTRHGTLTGTTEPGLGAAGAAQRTHKGRARAPGQNCGPGVCACGQEGYARRCIKWRGAVVGQGRRRGHGPGPACLARPLPALPCAAPLMTSVGAPWKGGLTLSFGRLRGIHKGSPGFGRRRHASAARGGRFFCSFPAFQGTTWTRARARGAVRTPKCAGGRRPGPRLARAPPHTCRVKIHRKAPRIPRMRPRPRGPPQQARLVHPKPADGPCCWLQGATAPHAPHLPPPLPLSSAAGAASEEHYPVGGAAHAPHTTCVSGRVLRPLPSCSHNGHPPSTNQDVRARARGGRTAPAPCPHSAARGGCRSSRGRRRARARQHCQAAGRPPAPRASTNGPPGPPAEVPSPLARRGHGSHGRAAALLP